MSSYTWSEARGQQPPAPAAPAEDTITELRLRRISELAYAPGEAKLDRRDLVVLLEGDEAMVRAQLGQPAPFSPEVLAAPAPAAPAAPAAPPAPAAPADERFALLELDSKPSMPPKDTADIPAATRRRRKAPAAQPTPAAQPELAPAQPEGLTPSQP